MLTFSFRIRESGAPVPLCSCGSAVLLYVLQWLNSALLPAD